MIFVGGFMFGNKCCRDKDGKKAGWCYCRCIGGIAIAIALAFVFAWVVMALWNWLMPDLFKLGTIGYVQALGLMVLARAIFGFGGRHKGMCGYGHHNHDASCGCETDETDKKESDKGTTK
jgi:hypothetical protein